MQSSGNKLLDAFTSALSSFGAREQYSDQRSDVARQGINTYNKQIGDRLVGLVMYMQSEKDKIEAKETLEKNRVSDDLYKDKVLKQQKQTADDIISAIVSAGKRSKDSGVVGNANANIQQPDVKQERYGINYGAFDTPQSPWQEMFMPLPASTNPTADLDIDMVVVPGSTRSNTGSTRGKQFNAQGQEVMPRTQYNRMLQEQRDSQMFSTRGLRYVDGKWIR